MTFVEVIHTSKITPQVVLLHCVAARCDTFGDILLPHAYFPILLSYILMIFGFFVLV